MNQDPAYVEAQDAALKVQQLLHRYLEFDLDGIEFMELASKEIQKITNFFENGNSTVKIKDPKQARTLYQDLEEGLDDERLEDLELYDPESSQGSLFKKGNG